MRTTTYLRPVVVVTLLFAGCGSDDPATPPAPTSKIATDPSRAVSQTIGVEGGTLTTTAADGSGYTLEIPFGALTETETITMTPVTGIDGYPLPGGPVAGVLLRPSGLTFQAPVSLSIETAATPPDGQVAAAILSDDEAEEFRDSPTSGPPGTYVQFLTHFSTATLGFGTRENLEAIPDEADEITVCLFSMAETIEEDPDDVAAQMQLSRDCLQNIILPAAQAAATAEQLIGVMEDYHFWTVRLPIFWNLSFQPVTAFPDLIAQINDALVPKIKQAIEDNNTLCEQSHDIVPLANALLVQTRANGLSLATPENGLDAETVVANLCARVGISDASLPENMQVGFPHSLDLEFHLRFEDGTEIGEVFQVVLTAENATLQNPTGCTDANGRYTTVVTAQQSGPVTVFIEATWLRLGAACEYQPPEGAARLEETFVIDSASSGLDLTGSYVGGGVFNLPGTAITTLEVTQNQNAIVGVFQTRDSSGSHSGRFTATLSGTALLGVEVELDGCDLDAPTTSGSVAASGDIISLRIDPTGTDCHDHVIGSMFVCGPNAVPAEQLAGTWTGAVVVNMQNGNLLVTAQLTGGLGGISGSFTGDVGGTISADFAVCETPFIHGTVCTVGSLTNIHIVLDCGGDPIVLQDGFVMLINGMMSFEVWPRSPRGGTCLPRELLRVVLSKPLDCNAE